MKKQIFLTTDDVASASDVFSFEGVTQVLEKAGIDARVTMGGLPTPQGESKRKELALTILVSGAAISAVLVALKGLIGPYLQARGATLEEEHIEALRDAKGAPVFDKSGQPVYRVLKRSRIEPAALGKSTSAMEADLAKSLHLKVTSSSGNS